MGDRSAVLVTLTDGQLAALRNLARKQAGVEVDWINIADAGALAELGFAERSRQGWTITAAGQAALAALGPEPAATASGVLRVFGRDRIGPASS